MVDTVDNLVLEQLRHLRNQNDKIIEEIRGLKVEVMAMRHHQRGLDLTRYASR